MYPGFPMTKPIRWGIVGTGAVSRQFASCLKFVPDAFLSAVYSRTLSKAESFADDFNIAEVYDQLDLMLSDSDVDVVYIATPVYLHKEHAISALKSGKSVIVEKPFAANANDAKEIIAVARKNNLFCMEAMWTRFNPTIQKLIEIVHSGRIGKIKLLHADLGFPVPQNRSEWLISSDRGGGALLDLGTYPLALTYSLLGVPDEMKSMVTYSDKGSIEQASIVLRYTDTLANLSCSFENNDRNNLFVLGEKATIEVSPPLYAPSSLTIRKSDRRRLRPYSGKFDKLLERSPYLVKFKSRYGDMLKRIVRKNEEVEQNAFKGFGYQFEIMEVMKCLRENRVESKVWRLSDTVSVLELTDQIVSDCSEKMSKGQDFVADEKRFLIHH